MLSVCFKCLRMHDNGMHAVTGKPVCLLCFVVSDALIHSSAGMGPFITTSTAWRSMCWPLLVKGLQDFAWAALCLVATFAQQSLTTYVRKACFMYSILFMGATLQFTWHSYGNTRSHFFGSNDKKQKRAELIQLSSASASAELIPAAGQHTFVHGTSLACGAGSSHSNNTVTTQ